MDAQLMERTEAFVYRGGPEYSPGGILLSGLMIGGSLTTVLVLARLHGFADPRVGTALVFLMIFFFAGLSDWVKRLRRFSIGPAGVEVFLGKGLRRCIPWSSVAAIVAYKWESYVIIARDGNRVTIHVRSPDDYEVLGRELTAFAPVDAVYLPRGGWVIRGLFKYRYYWLAACCGVLLLQGDVAWPAAKVFKAILALIAGCASAWMISRYQKTDHGANVGVRDGAFKVLYYVYFFSMVTMIPDVLVFFEGWVGQQLRVMLSYYIETTAVFVGAVLVPWILFARFMAPAFEPVESPEEVADTPDNAVGELR